MLLSLEYTVILLKMTFTFRLLSANWDTRSSFYEHQDERPDEQRRLMSWLGKAFTVEDVDDFDASCNKLIDIINDDTGSLFHEARVRHVSSSHSDKVLKEYVQEMHMPAHVAQRMRTEWGESFITHRRQLLQVVA